MPTLQSARLRRAQPFHALAGLSLLALLCACGGQPEAADEAAPAVDAVDNAVGARVDSVDEAAGGADNAAAPAEAPNAVETPVVAAASPTPTSTPSPVETAAAAPTPTPTPAAPAPGGDVANGAKLYAQCRICHAVEPDKHGLGPSLHGVVGRKAGALAAFNYSPAMKASGVVWTDAALDDYLRAPMKAMPGTKMAFAGIANDKNRADVIAYLATLK